MRQLKEIASEILEKKFSGDAKKMAADLGFDLSYVRRAVGLAALDGTTQQKAFEFTINMETMIQDELRMWKRGLQDQDWETHEAVKRRLSRLQGAIDRIGRADSGVIDTNSIMTER